MRSRVWMSQTYTEEQRMVADGVRAFVEKELMPHEQLVERLDSVPPELFAELKAKAIASGFYAMNMPESYGGGGLGQSLRVAAEIEFGRTTRALSIICNRPAPILSNCTGDQIETYLKPVIKGERWECFGLTEPGA